MPATNNDWVNKRINDLSCHNNSLLLFCDETLILQQRIKGYNIITQILTDYKEFKYFEKKIWFGLGTKTVNVKILHVIQGSAENPPTF